MENRFILLPVKSIGVVIPIYCPGSLFLNVLISMKHQVMQFRNVVIIDSTPDDQDRSYLEAIKKLQDERFSYYKIKSDEFDHGKTRNFGVAKLLTLNSEIDAVLFLTQDAVMQPNCLEHLVTYMNTHLLAECFARQLPREDADELEKIERLISYPTNSWCYDGVPKTIADVNVSDVCSLVRLDSFQLCNGFPNPIIFAEDMILACRLLKNGFKIGYCAEAEVRHSHPFAVRQTFRRYFDIGVMHTDWEKEIPLKNSQGKGFKFVWTVADHLVRNKPQALLILVLSTAAKLVGYKLGRYYRYLPRYLRHRFSLNQNYWTTNI